LTRLDMGVTYTSGAVAAAASAFRLAEHGYWDLILAEYGVPGSIL
jgi:hypothetical protein